jgi:hypothetical protein
MKSLASILIALGAFGAAGCSSDDAKTDGGDTPGASCQPTSADCYVDGPEGPGAECLALHDNSGSDKIQMRVSMLKVDSPPVLAQPFMQDAIITKKVTLAREQCNLYGDAQYNVLFEFDTAQKTVTSGGAYPHAEIGDPKTDGACYARFTDESSAIDVEPVTTDLEIDGNTFRAEFPHIVIPIFLEDKKDSYVLLPLSQLSVEAELSEDRNCIGRFQHETLSPDNLCAAPEGKFAWEGAGTYKSFITVEESDGVNIQSLGYTLCVLLSGDVAKWRGPLNEDGIAACKDSAGWTAAGNRLPTGDWCSTDNAPANGDCADAFRLETSFAASAIKITGDCS